MRSIAVTGMLGVTSACAVRYRPVIPVREQQFRSNDQPVALPLNPADSSDNSRDFLELGGNRFGRNPVPDAQGAGHRAALDALGVPANLAVRADLATSDFCAMAAPFARPPPSSATAWPAPR